MERWTQTINEREGNRKITGIIEASFSTESQIPKQLPRKKSETFEVMSKMVAGLEKKITL